MSNNTAEGRPVSDRPRFTDAELEGLLEDAFTASCWPDEREPATERRLAYLGQAAMEIVTRLNECVADGDVARFELPTVLVGAALAALRLAVKNAKEVERDRRET